jgi:hypothetical protein
MRPALLLLAALTLGGCGGGDTPEPEAAAPTTPAAAVAYSADVRQNFLTSCLENATNTAKGAATEEQLTRTCECILGKVEAEYSETEFAEFEKRLLAGEAEDEESGRLVRWSTDCAKEATS